MRKLLAAATVAMLGTIGLSALSTSAQAAASQESKEKEKVITVTGCLRAGEETGTFVLSNVKWQDKDKAAPGTTGTAGTESPAPAPISMRLVGTPSGVRMSEHLGHTVEITGFIVDEAQPRPSALPDPVATGTGGDRTSRTQPPAPKTQHTLNVRTVKLIEEGCAGR